MGSRQEAYRFSPINGREAFEQALAYIATNAGELAEQVVGQRLPIDTLAVFAHYDIEHSYLRQVIRDYGRRSRFTHGATLYVDSGMTVEDNHIKILGVRQPDPSRPQVGYADYPVDDYAAIREMHRDNPYLREITSGRGDELLELRHPDFDILGYIVAKEDHANG